MDSHHKETGHWNTSSKWQQECLKANADKLQHWEHWPADEKPENPRLINCFMRPVLFHTLYSSHITLRGVTFKDPPFWTLNPTLSSDIVIDHVTVLNPLTHAPNSDGIDPDSCANVIISNCHLTTGDDCIAIKSGRDKEVSLYCC